MGVSWQQTPQNPKAKTQHRYICNTDPTLWSLNCCYGTVWANSLLILELALGDIFGGQPLPPRIQPLPLPALPNIQTV